MEPRGPNRPHALPFHPRGPMPDEHTLDCRQLQCPMPIVKLSLAVKGLARGEQLVVQATDPAFGADLEAWASMTGHRILAFDGGDTMTARIQVA